MESVYYVIVDLDTLNFMKNGVPVCIEYADKFAVLEDAKNELETYNKDANVEIYKIIEFISRKIRKAE